MTKLGAAHQPLREQVRDAIRDRIVRGELPPGDRLVERALADEMGVSRVPVREALNLLKGEGLVQDVPRKGVIVTALTPSGLDELFEVREALEVHSVRLATRRAADGELGTLSAIVARAEAAFERGDLAAAADANQAFHDALTRLAHNALLQATLEPLEGRLHWVLRQNRDPSALIAEHRQLVSAISARDEDAAAAVALAHVATSRELCRAILFGAARPEGA